MRSFTSVALLAAAAAGTVRADNIECADGLYMLIARGTGEDPGPGETGKVANRIKDQIENSTVKGLNYPASFNGEVGDNNYFESVEKGYEAMKVAIQQYYDACPDHKMAIFGYSQGAQISSDALCGGSGGWFNDDRPPVDIDIIEKSIVSIVLFGDPSFVKDAPYSRGTAEDDGIFEREDDSKDRCEEIAERVVSYCDAGDYFCGPDIFNINKTVHTTYIDRYGDDVVDLVVNAYNNFEPELTEERNGLADQDDDSAAALLMPSFYAAPLLVLGLWHLL